MLEVVRFTLPERRVTHKFYNISMEVYVNTLKKKFIEKYKQLLGFLPQQELQDFVVVRIRRKLSMDDEVKTMNFDLFSIKKPDDVLIAVGINPKDSNVKRVVVEQLSRAVVEGNLIFNYKKMSFVRGQYKLKLNSIVELSATFTVLHIKNKNDLKKEKLFYLIKKIFEKREGRLININELLDRLAGKRIVKIELTYKQKFNDYKETGKKSTIITKRIQELIIEQEN